MKEDAPVPERVPRKRRQLESVPDRWIAVWLAGDLSPGDRKRLEEEKARRKGAEPPRLLGILAPQEGLTPAQLVRAVELVVGYRPSEVIHSRLPRGAHGAFAAVCRELKIDLRLYGDVRDELAAGRNVVRDAAVVIATPREATVQTYATPGVWSLIGLARHRGVPVTVVLPNGELREGGADAG